MKIGKWVFCLGASGLICLTAPSWAADAPTPKVLAAESDGRDAGKAVALGDRLTVTVTNLASLRQRSGAAGKPVILFLNGIGLSGIEPEAVDPNTGQLRFHLNRSKESRNGWVALLGKPQFETLVSVSVGVEGEVPIETHATKYKLVMIRPVGFLLFVAIGLVTGYWLWRKGKTSEMLRDPGPKPPEGKLRPYSLAKVQMAIWFWLAVASFLFIFLITFTFDSIPSSVFILMGISAATGLGVLVQDGSKDPDEGVDDLQKQQGELVQEHSRLQALVNPTPEQTARLTEVIKQRKGAEEKLQWHQQAPESEGFLKDILTDAQGTSFHRLQLFVWTLVLVFIFAWEVYHNLAMPVFDNTLLALMGISSGTYLGFMIPERHSSHQQAAPNA